LLVGLGLVLDLCAAVAAVRAEEPAASAPGPSELRPVRNVLLVHVVPRTTPALIALEHAFVNALKSATPDRLSLSSEYLDLAVAERKEAFERELIAYLAAKYAGAKLDLVVLTATESVRFVLPHRDQVFPGVPIVFISVLKHAVDDLPLTPDVSGVWVSIDWKGTLSAARALQPDLEHAVVVSGASALDGRWSANARGQLAELDPPLPVSYLENMTIEAVLERVAVLPAKTVVLVGAFLADASGRRFSGPDVAARVATASPVPVYGTSETHLGHGIVGGHLISFERQGRRGAEIAAAVLRGERPPPDSLETLAYRFDSRQLRRFGLDARRLPPGSSVEFEEPSLWQASRGYVVAAILLLALQTWTIAVLLVNRAQRRRAQRTLAGQLRFETLVSDLLASHLALPTTGVDSQIQQALARIGGELEADRVSLAERREHQRGVEITHSWAREGIQPISQAVPLSRFPWMAGRLVSGNVVSVSPSRSLPPEAEADRLALRRLGTRSMVAVPLMLDKAMVGVLSCSTVRKAREWPDTLIERLRLLAEVFATALARRRAEAAAQESEERFRRQRQELTHALRVNTLGELGVSLAHEINQPLSAILMNARAMSVLLARGTGEQTTMQEVLGDIAADAKRAGDIIDRLRALSRKEAVIERRLDVDLLVDEVVGLMRQDFVRRGIAVRRVTSPGLPRLTGDPIQIQQIFLNLLLNACEALEGVERGTREITIATEEAAPRLVEVAVRDTGVGTTGMDLERMFERFVTTKPGGVGMGLAISRSIVEAHGGRIYARPNADRGLTVFVELPAES
jgi:signal transduction histidine kinase